MEIIKDLGKIRNPEGKLRHMVLVKCLNCGVEKSTRKDMPQKTKYCSPCNKKTHGDTGSRLYTVWSNMKARCSNPQDNRWKYYGAKGITVCTEWENSYSKFQTWALSNGYSDFLTIDRIDNSKNYCPENCRWATIYVQATNKTYPKGKSGYHGVTTRHVVQLRQENKTLLHQEVSSPELGAYIRELFILDNKLEHVRNFPDLSKEQIMYVINKLKH
jgi:hypothetical protein